MRCWTSSSLPPDDRPQVDDESSGQVEKILYVSW
jgi:hypothetical protein